jgi:Flp pilus assembly protein TadD
MRQGFRTAIVCALLFGGTLLLFWRATACGFVNIDDPIYVTNSPRVVAGLSWAGAAWAFTAPSDYWHPLATLSHMLDCQLYGLSPAGHHSTSVLWHAINAVLAFLVFRALTGGMWRSAFAAALFAWHPLRVESVVWITERKDVMSGCFFLLTVLAYVRYSAAHSAGRPALRLYLLSLVCFAGGLMSKPMVVTLPFVLILLDYWPLARLRTLTARQMVLEKLPFFALSAAAAVVTVLMQGNAEGFVLDLPMAARIENALVSLVRYLGKFIWPFDLIVCYKHPGSWPAATVLGAAALLSCLLGIAWWQRRRRPWIAVGLGWYLVTLLPAIGLVQAGFQSMADRYTYLPLLGVELALVQCIPAATTRSWRIAAACAASALLGAFALRTWDQEGVWRNSETLFGHAVRVDSRNDYAEYFLSSALFAAGKMDDARVHAERAVAINPANDQAMSALADIYDHLGRSEEAMALFRSSLAIRPDNPRVECQLGLLELGHGNPESARALMIPALRSSPEVMERTLELARNALEHGDARTALFLCNLVLAVAPDNADANAGAGFALLARHDASGAIGPLRVAARGNRAPAEVQIALAECAGELGQASEAAAALARAEAGSAGNTAVLSMAADLYARGRDFDAAIRVYRRVLALDPYDSRAHAALGYLLVHAGDRDGGVAEWRRALELKPDFPGLRQELQRMGQ